MEGKRKSGFQPSIKWLYQCDRLCSFIFSRDVPAQIPEYEWAAHKVLFKTFKALIVFSGVQSNILRFQLGDLGLTQGSLFLREFVQVPAIFNIGLEFVDV
ncbi:uncharacterized protein N7500_009277 [Penicillium coprophilum]|uniref:uncharacterized protein n=1 Tax=Penicillium coprophilum TaxID=36646 RepID=UPI00239B78A3|nr:uncharacterized protein N7500_009277 [Penicillium coprophilum]KAJ5153838.1 hypothetical protein N7500_009277 [Penicillium coprophilum]